MLVRSLLCFSLVSCKACRKLSKCLGDANIHGCSACTSLEPYAIVLVTVQVVDMAAAELAPEGWAGHERPARLAAPTDASIYELHVRDFSVSDATVPARLRGKYLAFGEADTAGERQPLGWTPWPLIHPCCQTRTQP